jgi:hypothetical protein
MTKLFTSVGVAYRAVHHVDRAAIRALGCAVFGDIKIDLGMRVPLLHACQGRWAKDAALGVQVGGFEFDGFASSHGAILEEEAISITKPL